MEYKIRSTGNELTHWGIKGMHWGVRRYQNKDGSLTQAGKKRYAEEEAKLKAREKTIKGREKAAARQAKLEAKKAELDAREKALDDPKSVAKLAPVVPKKKTIGDLTDDELRNETNRMRLEKEYYDARKNLAVANPPKVSAGKKFVTGLLDDVVIPASKSAGKAWLEKFMKRKLGLEDKASLERLEKQAKQLKATKEIEEYKRDIEKLRKGKSDDGYSLDELLEAYRNIPEETRNDLADAAKIQENLNKVNKKKN